MSPLTDHFQCLEMTSTLLSALFPLLVFQAAKRSSSCAASISNSTGQSSWNLSHNQDSKPGVWMWMFVPSQGPGTVPVVGQQSECSEIKGRILLL